MTAEDRWVLTDDADGSGDPSLAHVLHGAGAVVTPTSVTNSVSFSCAGTEGVTAAYELTVPPGASITLMHFGVQQRNRELARMRAMFLEIAPPEALVGMDAAQRMQVVNWRLVTGPGSLCRMASDCPESAPYCVDGVCCTSSCGGGTTDDCLACTA